VTAGAITVMLTSAERVTINIGLTLLLPEKGSGVFELIDAGQGRKAGIAVAGMFTTIAALIVPPGANAGTDSDATLPAEVIHPDGTAMMA
jgi:hypothetical protein